MNTIQIIGLIGMVGYFIYHGIKALPKKPDFNKMIGSALMIIIPLTLAVAFGYLMYVETTRAQQVHLLKIDTEGIDNTSRGLDSIEVYLKRMDDYINSIK